MNITKRKLVLSIGAALAATAVYAALQITVNTPIALSDGDLGDKPKIQRAGDGTLVVAYGDNTPGAGVVYDVKATVERAARDIYVKTCKPGTVRPDTVVRTCDDLGDWSAAINVSQSALLSSISTAWEGGDPVANSQAYPGDIDKANIKTSGPMMVLTWIGNYCPDGDLASAGIQAPVQRAIRYLERDNRVIPFACTWAAYSKNNGVTWSAPIQLSTGERDAKQDSSSGSVNTDITSSNYRKGQVAITWQEDPQGLQLGEADGPGDGASGANVNGGTDVWYAYATVDLSDADTANDFVPVPAVRLTDNWQGLYGISGQLNAIFDGNGLNVDPDLLEKGQAGASRANIGMVGSTAIAAYEETKGSEGLDEGKFVRYNAFTYNAPPVASAGCIISNPLKNARRVRFLTQSSTDAGAGGIYIGIFWKEGIYDKGGPSDIVVRRGMGGFQPANMVPAVDATCATSDYLTAIGLNSVRAENISSMAPTATVANLTDDTEFNFTENALAHRGVLRGTDMWVGYNYTNDLVDMWAQLDNYNFWLRKFTVGGGWEVPINVTNITDKNINVREPRIFGTPKSNATTCPSGDPAAPDTTDPTTCQDTNVIYLAWGTQENVSPFDLDGGDDLGIYITVSNDSASTFATPVRYSTAAGSLFQDDEYAFESQVVTRPDGTRFYGAWNQGNTLTGMVKAQYASGDVAVVDDPLPPPVPVPVPVPAPADVPTPVVPLSSGGGGGGCAISATGSVDPLLPGMALIGLGYLALRRRERRANV